MATHTRMAVKSKQILVSSFITFFNLPPTLQRNFAA